MELLVIAILLTVADLSPSHAVLHTGQSTASTRFYTLPVTPPRPTTFPGVKEKQVVGYPLNTVVVAGKTAKLYCRYHLNSCLEIRWQKRSASGQPANISYGNRVYHNGYLLETSSVCTLVIPNVQLMDSGTFICTIPGPESWSANLIVLQSEPSCSSDCKHDSTAEKDIVKFKCELAYRGRGRPVMTWWKKLTWLEIDRAPPERLNGGYVSRDLSWNAEAPRVPPLVCLIEFSFDETPGWASNTLEVKCDTGSCNILYAVRNVETAPEWFASPGEEIICKADGNPPPTTFEWQQKENDGDGEWKDVPDETSKKIKAPLNNGTSYQLRCVAKNTIRKVEHPKESAAVTVSKHGAAIRTAIIVVVVVGVVIMVIIGGLAYKKKPASEGRVGQWSSL